LHGWPHGTGAPDIGSKSLLTARSSRELKIEQIERERVDRLLHAPVQN
jgi:hypothetical protein